MSNKKVGDKRRHIHIDLVGGLAGDMFLAAAIDAGLVSIEAAEAELRKVGLGPVEIVAERIVRGAIEGTHIRFANWDEKHDSDHRHLSTIRKMLGESGLAPAVRARALEMFEVLGRAESEVHGIELDRVHFHEVGAVDSILDFVAAAWVIEEAGATWSTGKIPVGTGTIETAHGTIPLPAPATARVLKGLDVVYRDVETEFVTPTGATILSTVAGMPGERRGKMAATGFGCGSRDVEGISNVVRLVVLEGGGAVDEVGPQREAVVQLVTEIDDETPEVTAHVARILLESGALDVVREPVQMKKGRLGTRLSVLCHPDKEAELVRRIFLETTTFGIRRMPMERWILRRSQVTVKTPFGPVLVKVGELGDGEKKISPEYDSCAALAEEAGLSIRQVFEAARAAATTSIAGIGD